MLFALLFFEWFPFPLGALDRMHHFIVTIPEPSIHCQLFGYQIIPYIVNFLGTKLLIIDKLTAQFSWPFEI